MELTSTLEDRMEGSGDRDVNDDSVNIETLLRIAGAIIGIGVLSVDFSTCRVITSAFGWGVGELDPLESERWVSQTLEVLGSSMSPIRSSSH